MSYYLDEKKNQITSLYFLYSNALVANEYCQTSLIFPLKSSVANYHIFFN